MSERMFDRGLKTRREVLGAPYVDAVIQNADSFDWPVQELATEYGWGAVWSRPGLDRRTRSLIVLAMLIALNRPPELRVHIRGAINNGVTQEEIAEAFLQAAVYCGMPAAIDSFRIAKEVFTELAI